MKVVTIRYYEETGIMPVTPVLKEITRLCQEHVDRLRFVRRCRDLGFSMEQIRDLLQLCSAEKASSLAP